MGQAQDLFPSLNRAAAVSNEMLKYDWQEYRYIKTIGDGAFGEVYLVRRAGTRRVFALKKIKCGSNDDLDSVTQELKSMSKLDHPNIMKLVESRCKQKGLFHAELYMILEYLPGGTLGDRLQEPSTKAQNIKWMRELANAVAYIHAFALVHRDLKPDNILLNKNDDIKVGDFGLARDFVAAKRQEQTWEDYYMSSACGTLFYMAPEVFEGHYTEKADVFALGVLLYAIQERECFEINGIKCYGIFIRLNDYERAPLGMQMHFEGKALTVPFTKCDAKLASIIGSALMFDQKSRADAATIHRKLNE